MNKADYKKASEREVKTLDDLDRDVVRRIANWLRVPHTLESAAKHFNIPLDLVRDIARHIGR